MVVQYVSKKVSDLSAFIFSGYPVDMYPTCIGIGYVSRYTIRYGLKYPCFIGSTFLLPLVLLFVIAVWLASFRV
jgi:hypothetical protein